MNTTIFEKKNQFRTLLISYVALGILLGGYSSTWQYAVENAQHLAGIVSYEDKYALPNFYHAALFSITNFIPILTLKIFNSEIISSIFLSIFIAVLSTLVIGLISFLITRSTMISALIATFIMTVNFCGEGINYPILLLDSSHTHGRVGISIVLLSAVLFAYEKYRAAFFLASLSVGFQSVWGLWLNGILITIFALNFREFKQLITRDTLRWYLTGVFLVLISYLWHCLLSLELNVKILHSSNNDLSGLLNNYIENFDFHRKKISDFKILIPAIFYSTTSILLSVILKASTTNRGEKLFFYILIFSGFLSWPFVFYPSWFNTEFAPEILIFAMPGRLINFSIIPSTALLLSIFLSKKISWNIYNFFIAFILFIIIFVNQLYLHQFSTWSPTNFIFIAFWPIYLSIIFGTHFFKFQSVFNPVFRKRVSLFFIAACFLLAPIGIINSPQKLLQRLENENLYINNIFKGKTVLSYQSGSMFSLMYRLPTLTPNITYYTFNIFGLTNARTFMLDLYGIDIAKPFLEPHPLGITPIDIKKYWESMTCEQWHDLSTKYKFTLIEAANNMNLNLKRYSENELTKIYEVTCKISTSNTDDRELDYPSFLSSNIVNNPIEISLQKKDSFFSQPTFAPLNTTISFAKNRLGTTFLENIGGFFTSGFGWSNPESWGVWSEGKQAKISIPLKQGSFPNKMTIKLRALVSSNHPHQKIDIFVNGLLMKSIIFENTQEKEIEVLMPDDLRGKFLQVEFFSESPMSPSKLNIGSDTRSIGIGLIEIKLIS